MPDFKTMWLESDPVKRNALQDRMQEIILQTPKKEFDDFDRNPAAVTENPVLDYYDHALDRLLSDIPATTVRAGNAVVWYLYNLGFVIKTPDVCFGVDLHHRRAEKLEPYLDFLITTHNHDDHYSIPLMYRMSVAGKPVITNFFPASGYTKAVEFTHNIKGVTIHCGEADHNTVLRRFTMPVEVICPTGDREFIFFTSGDCCTSESLRKHSARIHLYAVHPLCGMNTVDAVLKLEPDWTLIGHLQELGHENGRYRWSFEDGRHEMESVSEIGRKSVVPVWGEKFLWDGETITGCQE